MGNFEGEKTMTSKQQYAAHAREILQQMRENGKQPSQKQKFLIHPTPLRAIRLFCLECQADSRKGVRDCPDKQCPLWNFRTKRKHKQ